MPMNIKGTEERAKARDTAVRKITNDNKNLETDKSVGAALQRALRENA